MANHTPLVTPPSLHFAKNLKKVRDAFLRRMAQDKSSRTADAQTRRSEHASPMAIRSLGTVSADTGNAITVDSSPIITERATVDGVVIRYARATHSSGVAVLLTSPWPESLFAYLPIWELLSRDFSLLAIDLPGFGQSEGRADLMSPRAMGQFVVRVADHFGLDRPHVIAPDVGTPTMLFAASDHPERFRSLVVGAGASTFPLQVADILKDIIDAPTLAPYQALDPAVVVGNATARIRNYVVPGFVRDDYVTSYAGARFVESMAFVRRYVAELPLLADRLERIATPVQIIAGRRDPEVLILDAELLHQRLPNSKLAVLDCGHAAWEEASNEYAHVASAWLTGGYRSRGS
jgi:pimeloyl-ACP methyl ester carboxylesterase